MSTIVRNVNLFPLIRTRVSGIRTADAIGKLEILGTIELVEHISVQVENYYSHHFALDNNDACLVVDIDTTRMLQNVGTKFSNKLAVLVVDLNLMSRRSLCHDNISRLLYNAHSIRIEQLTVAFTTLAKLELEITVLVKDLNTMRIGVGNNNVIVGVDCHATWFSKLTVVDAKLAKFAMIDHFRSIELQLMSG